LERGRDPPGLFFIGTAGASLQFNFHLSKRSLCLGIVCYPGKPEKLFHASSNHSDPQKILLTKLFALLILPLEEWIVFFRSAQGD
jgi:hypothetical protein